MSRLRASHRDWPILDTVWRVLPRRKSGSCAARTRLFPRSPQWSNSEWILQRTDGRTSRFQDCEPHSQELCSILEERDSRGNIVQYNRDAVGRLTRMSAAPDRWIELEYDDDHRIVRAPDSTKRAVRYEYDPGGRLAIVTTSDGIVHRYAYSDRDEMTTILEPGPTSSISSTRTAGAFAKSIVTRIPRPTSSSSPIGPKAKRSPRSRAGAPTVRGFNTRSTRPVSPRQRRGGTPASQLKGAHPEYDHAQPQRVPIRIGHRFGVRSRRGSATLASSSKVDPVNARPLSREKGL